MDFRALGHASEPRRIDVGRAATAGAVAHAAVDKMSDHAGNISDHGFASPPMGCIFPFRDKGVLQGGGSRTIALRIRTAILVQPIVRSDFSFLCQLVRGHSEDTT